MGLCWGGYCESVDVLLVWHGSHVSVENGNGLGVNGTASLTTIMATSLYVVWNSMEYYGIVRNSME